MTETEALQGPCCSCTRGGKTFLLVERQHSLTTIRIAGLKVHKTQESSWQRNNLRDRKDIRDMLKLYFFNTNLCLSGSTTLSQFLAPTCPKSKNPRILLSHPACDFVIQAAQKINALLFYQWLVRALTLLHKTYWNEITNIIIKVDQPSRFVQNVENYNTSMKNWQGH